jgi:uncharacterized protein involved in outer membrane biogenesis
MKTLIKVGVIAILLIVAAVAVLSFYLDSMIKAGVEAVGPKITGTAVKLDGVSLSLLSGQARLKGLVVGNPPGFQTERSFKLADAKVKVDLKTALSNKLVIEEILIDGPEITYEGSSSGSNISKIQENVTAFGKSVTPKDAAESKSPKKDPTQKKVQINHFTVKNAQLNASTSMLKGKTTVSMPDIYLKDIGKDSGGVTVQTAATEVFAAINKSVVQSVSRGAEEAVKSIGSEAAKSIGSEAEKSGSKAVEGLKGLLGK